MDSFLQNHERMQSEHASWLSVVRELRRLEVDINGEEQLHAAIVYWGEQLFRLRMAQDETVWAKAYDEAKKLYNQHIGFLPSAVHDA